MSLISWDPQERMSFARTQVKKALAKALAERAEESEPSALLRPGSPESMELAYRRAFMEEIDRYQVIASDALAKLGLAELAQVTADKGTNELLAKLADRDAELEGLYLELESHQDALCDAEDKLGAFAEAETVTYALSPEDRLDIDHLEHRHNLLAERVDCKVQPALKEAARATHRSRWLLGFVFLLVASAALVWATEFGIPS